MWINIPSAVPKIAFTFIFYRGKFPAIQLWIGNQTKEENEIIYEKIKSHQSKLESIFPNLIWYNKPENKSKIIIFQRDKEYDFSDDSREEVMEWFSKSMQKFEKSFNPILKNL